MTGRGDAVTTGTVPPKDMIHRAITRPRTLSSSCALGGQVDSEDRSEVADADQHGDGVGRGGGAQQGEDGQEHPEPGQADRHDVPLGDAGENGADGEADR